MICKIRLVALNVGLVSVLRLSMFLYFFFFKQKTAYEMRISDWSSDVCSSDLRTRRAGGGRGAGGRAGAAAHHGGDTGIQRLLDLLRADEMDKIGRASCRERVCQYV